jgi:hypothetical protein
VKRARRLTVNKEEFLDVNREDWWLVDPAAPTEVQQMREQLGAALGYGTEQTGTRSRSASNLSGIWSRPTVS